jgi:hypothetical protein
MHTRVRLGLLPASHAMDFDAVSAQASLDGGAERAVIRHRVGLHSINSQFCSPRIMQIGNISLLVSSRVTTIGAFIFLAAS